jgi:hypothetical protein
MEINLPIAFGSFITPDIVGDFTNRDTQYEWANATGVIFHESLHARFSEWEQTALDAMDKDVFSTFQLLDESRIERYGVINIPENSLFLRSSALDLSLGEVDNTIDQLSDVRLAGVLCLLALARVDAGVLRLTDVQRTYEKVVELIGNDYFDKFRAIWVEFQKLTTADIVRAEQLAKEWNDLLNELDPKTDKGTECEFPTWESGESGESGEKGKRKRSISKDELLGALEQDADDTDTSNRNDLNEQQLTNEQKEQLSQKQERQSQIQKAKNQASKTFSSGTGPGASGSDSRLQQTRTPNGKERASAVKIAQMLEKAKYRERSITDVKSVLPQGRLKTRIAIQNLALKAKGVRNELPAWERTIRKHTDDPTLSIGVMVDVSGSMGGAMESMATTAWVLSEAGRRVQARNAMVYFGSGVFPTLKVGQKLEQVSVYSAPDGTEKFDEGWQALDGHLGLSYSSGVRLLVVVSDGHFTPSETANARRAVELCKRNGVAVLWIVPDGCYGNSANHIVGNNGVVLNGMKVSEIAMAIGKSATDALTKVSLGV